MPAGTDPHESLRNSLAAGLCLIALGLGLVLQDGLELRSLWPYFPLALGVAHIVRPDLRDGGRRSLLMATWWILLGAWGLANVYHVLGMRYRTSWPLLLIVVGATQIWEALLPESQAEGEPGQEDRTS